MLIKRQRLLKQTATATEKVAAALCNYTLHTHESWSLKIPAASVQHSVAYAVPTTSERERGKDILHPALRVLLSHECTDRNNNSFDTSPVRPSVCPFVCLSKYLVGRRTCSLVLVLPFQHLSGEKCL